MLLFRYKYCMMSLLDILRKSIIEYLKFDGGTGMKRYRIAKICMAVCLTFGLIITLEKPFAVQAAEVTATVQGTVMSGTTSELLYLSTNEGKMEIKLDSGTDASACKILLPDTKISVSVTNGSDGYLHAVKITSDTQKPSATIDTSTTATVTGKIGEKSKGDLLYFNTPQGEMQIKLDTTTNMSGCSVLVADKNYTIVCARGSDAYMHAISISDGVSGSVAASSGLTPAPADPSNRKAATMTVTGTVGSSTKENLLYLSTSGGEMQFVIEGNTDSTKGMVLTKGSKLTVSYYHGSDAYLHAVDIVGVKNNLTVADIDTSSTATVSGTVGSKSNEDLLYLDTQQGTMELKLDGVRSVTGCKVFISGKKLTLTCARGSDAYMHALDITG